MKINKFLSEFKKVVPDNLALSFDNVGLLVGDDSSEIKGIYICLDVSDKVLQYVIDNNFNLIISHHPIIFSGIKRFLKNDSLHMKLVKCINNDINVVSYHTNLDAISNGLNDQFIDLLGIKYKKIDILEINKIDNKCGIGRIVDLESSIGICDIVDIVKEKFNINNIRIVSREMNLNVKRICVINGLGNSMIKDCYNKGIDLVITGDITYHTAFDALENSLSLIDMGHFNSENIVYKMAVKHFIKYINGLDVKVCYDDLLEDVYKYV